MAKKIKTTRPELKRHRDALERFERYLPTLKLKQQQLQLKIRQLRQRQRSALRALDEAKGKFQPYRSILSDPAGVNVPKLAEPTEVKTARVNVAGISVPVFQEAVFAPADYSLFATPAWVDRALADLRHVNLRQVEIDVLRQQYDLLHKELVKIIQRVNLFEKVKIPEAREAIRVIRIHLGDQMTAAVGRAKIAKGKLAEADYAAGVDEAAGAPAAAMQENHGR